MRRYGWGLVVGLLLLGAAQPGWAQEIGAVTMRGPSPYIRMQGTEAGGGYIDIVESAGSLQVIDRTTGTVRLNLGPTASQAVANGVGAEKVRNGAMAAATGWTAGAQWDINVTTPGKAHKAAGGITTLSQTSANMVTPLVAAQLYRLTYTLSAYVGTGTLTPSLGGATGRAVAANGTYVDYLLASSTAALTFTPSVAGDVYELDDVSLVQVGTQAADQVTSWVEDSSGAGTSALVIRSESGAYVKLGQGVTVGQVTAPTCAGGGACTATGSDTAAIITAGGAGAITVTFNKAFPFPPACVAQNQTTAANYVTKTATTVSTAVITTAAGPGASDLISLICVGVR